MPIQCLAVCTSWHLMKRNDSALDSAHEQRKDERRTDQQHRNSATLSRFSEKKLAPGVVTSDKQPGENWTCRPLSLIHRWKSSPCSMVSKSRATGAHCVSASGSDNSATIQRRSSADVATLATPRLSLGSCQRRRARGRKSAKSKRWIRNSRH